MGRSRLKVGRAAFHERQIGEVLHQLRGRKDDGDLVRGVADRPGGIRGGDADGIARPVVGVLGDEDRTGPDNPVHKVLDHRDIDFHVGEDAGRVGRRRANDGIGDRRRSGDFRGGTRRRFDRDRVPKWRREDAAGLDLGHEIHRGRGRAVEEVREGNGDAALVREKPLRPPVGDDIDRLPVLDVVADGHDNLVAAGLLRDGHRPEIGGGTIRHHPKADQRAREGVFQNSHAGLTAKIREV